MKWIEVFVTVQRSCKASPCDYLSWVEVFTGSLVSWPLSRAAQARPGPFPPDREKAIAMMHNPCASGLSRAVWPPRENSVVGREDINAGPHFRRGAALEVVMRSDVVVPRANLRQAGGKLRAIVYGCLREGGLHRADEALDAAILPGTAGIRALRPDAQEPQCKSEPSRGKDRFVVGAHILRRAIPPERADEVLQQGQRRLVTELAQAQTGATRVIEDSQHHMLRSLRVRLDCQIHSPNQIARDRAGHAVFEPPSYTKDCILVSADRIGDESFADGHLRSTRKAPIEAVRDGATAGLGHQGFQTDDLFSHPGGFGRRVGPAHRPPDAGARPVGPGLRAQPA